MGNELKAIETRYAGCRFRSRLEARWAVFFDALKVPWQYEREGFEFDAGLSYLPDFWLPHQCLWFEVKGEEPCSLDVAKAVELSKRLPDAPDLHRIAIAWGSIPTLEAEGGRFRRSYPHGADCGAFTIAPGLQFQSDCEWLQCPTCSRLYFELDLGAPCLERHDGHGQDHIAHRSAELARAYQSALSARFEHGEKG